MTEQDQIIKEIIHKANLFVQDRIRVLNLYMAENNIFEAENVARDLTKGLDTWGEYLLEPKAYIKKQKELTSNQKAPPQPLEGEQSD